MIGKSPFQPILALPCAEIRSEHTSLGAREVHEPAVIPLQVTRNSPAGATPGADCVENAHRRERIEARSRIADGYPSLAHCVEDRALAWVCGKVYARWQVAD
jgi:hypothetical protein